MDLQLVRKFILTIPLPSGNLVAGASQAGIEMPCKARIVEAELFLGGTGTGAGNTDVDVHRNGSSVLTAPGLRIASASATSTVRVKPANAQGEPPGQFVDVGDKLTVDVDAIPATTASKNGLVFLYCIVVDV